MTGGDAAGGVLGAQRETFAVPPDIAYFNTATRSPQLHSVRAAGEVALERRGRPWAIAPDDWFSDVERLRTLFGGLVGADAEGSRWYRRRATGSPWPPATSTSRP